MQRHSLVGLTAAATAAMLTAAPLDAQIVSGSTLVFTGVADATDVGLAGVLLGFAHHVAVSPSANTGTFASLNKGNGKGANGSIDDLVVGHGPQAVHKFLSVGAYKFDIASLPSGMYGQDDCYVEPVIGQTCTPYQSVVGDPTQNVGLSPFYVTNLASGNPAAPFTGVASFNVVGTVTGPGHSVANFLGTISSTFVGQSYQEVLYTLELQGLTGVTFTGTFVTRPSVLGGVMVSAVPEPATSALVLTGLGVVGVVGVVARRRRA